MFSCAFVSFVIIIYFLLFFLVGAVLGLAFATASPMQFPAKFLFKKCVITRVLLATSTLLLDGSWMLGDGNTVTQNVLLLSEKYVTPILAKHLLDLG